GTTHNDEQSRATLVGVRPNLGRGHLLRALLEGLAYCTRENLDVLGAELGLAADEPIVAIGGATRSRPWIQLKADVYGRAVRVSQAGESVALGAALLAGIGGGRFADAAAAVASLRAEEETFRPAAAASAAYARRYRALYLPLYAALREVNLAIDGFEQG